MSGAYAEQANVLSADGEAALPQVPPLRPVQNLQPPVLLLEGVSKSFGRGSSATHVLHDLNLSIAEGEFIAIVGFSGSGKSTLMNLIAGLEHPDSGTISVRGKPVSRPGPDRALVFQSYSLLPWLTVAGNVQLAVDQVFPKLSRQQRRDLTMRHVELVNLGAASHKLPRELSGGMRQRVAVARALAMNPDILLLDEPLSALDALTRAKLQDEITRIWQQDSKTVVMITNDVDEALLLADRVIPLQPGPRASLGPDFVVDIERPRDRADMNHNPDFIALRKAVIGHLVESAAKPQDKPSGRVVTLPTALPSTRMDESAAAEPAKDGHIQVLPDPQVRSRTPEQLRRYVEFFQVGKTYPSPGGGSVDVVKGFDLNIRKGEFVSVIGHSGCGKSTVLSMAAGLTDISAGGIVLDGKEVTSAGPDRGIVFQAPSLFPWLTAFDNVAVGIRQVYQHVSAAERRDIAEYYLERVGLKDAMQKPATDLSGGMKQRVGIARAFALSPKLLLLDEPFGMLDSLTRWELQEVLMDVWERTKVTAIMVTHDVDEAVLLSDRVVMMSNGPEARVGQIEEVSLPRKRVRRDLLDVPAYYQHREALLTFLRECDHTT